EPVAIVGSGCRFPGGSTSPSCLWQLLENPRDIRKEIPLDRFNIQGYYHPDAAHHGTTNVRYAYLLDEDVRAFDAGFFNINRKEADSIDPQQRMLMETVYEALDSGGHTIEKLRGSDTAVYVGVMGLDYEGILMRDVDDIPTYTATGISRAILSNRISYFFDWHGPSLTIDTACSSSLIAVHQGVQALRTGESRLAVACGTTAILGPDPFMTENRLNMLSPDGRSRMWDADANGYARGEGVAVVILKRLSDAIADGDRIECLIRETGSNQDGHSTGLTVPSSEAQTALIQQTYAKAGLDPRNVNDRPQFFEAHGTGTRAGDPREAEAIQRCFGPAADTGRSISFTPNETNIDNEHPLYVGSIKTVIGHTEGAAGLAGLIKGSLAIQHGLIPANLLFGSLNPDIEPFYHGLHVPTSTQAWPALADGVPRRVSVNSFGFGGANAHAILESYQPSTARISKSLRLEEPITAPFTPFTFSAASEGSLFQLLESYSDYLKAHPDINLGDLAWTLQTCKSALNVKMTFAARSVEKLVSKLDDVVLKMKDNDKNIHSFRSPPKTPRILGVFTGQGAQWAGMGGCLIRSSAFVRAKLQDLEESLTNLPVADRPTWRLQDEILAGQETSRIGKAELSQPLCTAVQLVLVDLLREAGITFEAVVGHSSGEIAAAYAAGFITAHDAIRIAYYRGMHAHRAEDPQGSGQKGAMLAVGTSLEDARDLVELPAFRGRITVAAHNSSASVTLSGNVDAVIHAKKVFDEEKKFARMLKVDTAYHSHHMIPCGDAYIKSLQACNIQLLNREGPGSCAWYSSVVPGNDPMQTTESLKDVYWRDNMIQPVLFADAIKTAASEKINFALEVGPHPALRGPASQNIMEVRQPVAYSGVLGRDTNDIEAFADALGFVWAQLGSGSVDFRAYEDLMSDGPPPKYVAGLPMYPWNHEQKHWHESRQSKAIRCRSEPFHSLLGIATADTTNNDRRWKNLLKASEVPWLDGHRLEGQMIFPAAGYIAMALEAARSLAGDRDVKLFEIRDLVISKAVSFEDDANFSVETLVTLSTVTTAAGKQQEQSQTANFSCHAGARNGPSHLDLVATGSVLIVYNTPSPAILTSTPLETSTMNSIDTEDFYSSIHKIGYDYTGPFRAMSEIRRKLDQASALVSTYTGLPAENDNHDDVHVRELLVHPSWLDVAIQSVLAAGAHPEDESFRTLSVPTLIGRIRVNPALCAALPNSPTLLPVCASIHREQQNNGGSQGFSASIDVFSQDGQQTLIQAEDLTMKPLYSATSKDDRCPFTYVKWDVEWPDATSITINEQPNAVDKEIAVLCERMSWFYLRKWNAEILAEEWARGQAQHHRLRAYMDHALAAIARGEHPVLKEEWAHDTFEDLEPLIQRHMDSVDVRVIKATGENLRAVIRGETTMVEHLNDMRTELYITGLGFGKYSEYAAAMVKQLVHRYPQAKILELGAGSGGTTREVLQAIGDAFASYTFTDISDGFLDDFEKTKDAFKSQSHKMSFKFLDIEKSPATQGFEHHSYDIVIAANIVHATSSCQRSLENARKLLKPGGYLILVEITQPTVLRTTNMAAGLPGWWNAKDGRENGPLVTPGAWHNILRKAGFSGADALTPPIDNLTWPFSVIVSQAVNDQVDFLRRPLTAPSPQHLHFEEIVILGTGSVETSMIAEEAAEFLRRFCNKVTILDGLPTESDALSPMNTLISLVDLDEPVFKNLTQRRWDGLKRVYEAAKNLVWVTRGAHDAEPYHMASIGVGRALRPEIPYLALTFLDLVGSSQNASKVIAECMLRQCALDSLPASASGLLWSVEPEYVVENGHLMVPRLVANHDQNDRFNAQVRPVTKTVSPSRSAICISESGEWPPALQEDILPPVRGCQGVVQMEQSILVALNVSLNEVFLYPIIGMDETTGTRVLALSSNIASRVVPVAAVPIEHHSSKSSGSILLPVTAELLAASLLATLPSNSSLLVHEPSTIPFLANALTRQATEKAVHVQFSTSSTGNGANDNLHCIEIDAWTPKHLLQKKLPTRVTHFLDLTTNAEFNAVSLSLGRALPSSCSLVVPLAQISQIKEPMTIIDWRASQHVTLQITPIDARRLFSRHKTYILVGLTGQIGQSLCEWMARNGAGCICLTSRRPNVSEQWLESFKALGTVVKILTMDVTNRQAVQRCIDEIRATCPPIAGVANGAMVLSDVLLADMSLDQMQQVLQPKIDGSNHLADIFSDNNDDSNRLDFFVMFSSLSAVIGNPGQSNYAAANVYMQSLARQRRKRGLAASTFDIGRVVGIGYVERADPIVKEQLVRQKYLPISESDFHHFFAETILASRPDVDALSPVLTTAVFSAIVDEYRPRWAEDPRFSHCIRNSSQSVQTQQDDKSNNLPVFEQLESAKNMEEALGILKAAIVNKLRIILQITDRDIDENDPLIDHGIDSLVAVEVRSWFVKELKVDLPVLKILGGASISDLSEYALENLPEAVLANLGKEGNAQPSVEKPLLPTATAPAAVSSKSGDETPDSTNESSESTSERLPSENISTDISSAASSSLLDISETKAVQPPLRFLKSEPVSFAQSRFWFLRMLIQDQTTFTVGLCYKVTGNLRVGDLERAVASVGSRHETLRTAFVGSETERDVAYQKIMESSRLRLEHVKINSVEDVAAEYAKIKVHEFAIERGEVMRMMLMSLDPSTHYLLMSYHHIILDGISVTIFLQDLEKAYKHMTLGPPPTQITTLSKAQHEAYKSGNMNEALGYWRGVFSDEPPVLPLLPMAKVASRMPMDGYNTSQVHLRLDADLAARVRKASKAQRCTPFHLYLAVFKCMLFKFTEAQDLTVGIADAGRGSDAMGTIGLLLNLLPLRFRRKRTGSGQQRFSEAVTEARDTSYAALASSVPFDVLLKELNVPRSSQYSPFFQAFFDYRQGTTDKHAFDTCQFEMQDASLGRTAYDITLDINESSAGTILAIRTQTRLYDQAATDLLLNTYIGLLDMLSGNVSQPWESVPLFGAKQLTRAVELGRGPNLVSDWPETLPHRIDEITEVNRSKTAIMDGYGNSLTYLDLSQRNEAIAEALIQAGMGSGSRVLVFQKAAADWVCSMLAIMRIGGIYVPLDLRSPLPRLARIAQNCQPSGILVDATTADDATQLGVPAAQIIDVGNIATKPMARVPNCARGNSTAAILSTSGSTATPKGILVKHSGLRNEIEGYTKTWKLGAVRVLQQSAFSFNHSSDQMYTGLVNGGMVYIVPWSKRGDPIEITNIMKQHNITYTKATPSEYSLWLQYGVQNLRQCSSWRFAFGGGETLTHTVLRDVQALELPQLRLFNSYGPTEISISSHKMEVNYRSQTPEGRIACGYSLPNYVTYILDEQLRPLPPGVPGEVFIGGAGVAEGYLNEDDLNTKAFIPDLYAERHPGYATNGWTRMYRTGDIGHLTEDGALVFHNRVAGSTQVKIRGLRIDLSDIESNILSASRGKLKEAAVTLREDDVLVAHVVFATSGERSDTGREEFLHNLLIRLPLPQYMIPVVAIPLEPIQELPLPQRMGSLEGNDEFELTETMTQLRQVWEDILGDRSKFIITPTTSFFAVGGNSLLIVRLQSRIRDSFRVAINLIDLLGANTLGEMARQIEESSAVETIDWDKETALPDLDAPQQIGVHGYVAQSIRSQQKTVLVTGATGFLATHVLPQLTADSSVSKIYCIAVRDTSKLAATGSKVVSYNGDLTLPRLGLSEPTFTALSNEVDVILHMGAARSFWDNYHTLRPTNTSATRELVRLAAARRIPIHFTSSAGVLAQAQGNIPCNATPASAAGNIPPTDGSNGYVASKWASERILERAAEAWGLPVLIHRFTP
ncbi:hypothetical protein M406DRAFT_10616, partial [Cryphonectria parasitica EP155]